MKGRYLSPDRGEGLYQCPGAGQSAVVSQHYHDKGVLRYPEPLSGLDNIGSVGITADFGAFCYDGAFAARQPVVMHRVLVPYYNGLRFFHQERFAVQVPVEVQLLVAVAQGPQQPVPGVKPEFRIAEAKAQDINEPPFSHAALQGINDMEVCPVELRVIQLNDAAVPADIGEHVAVVPVIIADLEQHGIVDIMVAIEFFMIDNAEPR